MTAPFTEAQRDLDPLEEGIDEEESRRRRIERNQPLIALLVSWIAEGENANGEERRIAEAEWEELKAALDEHRLPGSKRFP